MDNTTKNTHEYIESLIAEHPVILFMKGTKLSPLCGFSARVVQILNTIGAQYEAINVLDDEDIRQGIKDYSNWPTIPQLYINKEFIGGCDIVTELYSRGELENLIS